MELFPHQKEAVDIIVNRDNPHFLLADDMGLGKTITSLGVARRVKAKTVVIVCPAFLIYNWESEVKSFTAGKRCPVIVNSKSSIQAGKINIISYEILKKVINKLSTVVDMSIIDEAHYIKNHKSLQSKAVFKLHYRSKRTLFLTGTPIPNKPIEMWKILLAIDNAYWEDKLEFGKRYCDAKKDYWGHWKMDGASNLVELRKILDEHFWLRRTKDELENQLPEKIFKATKMRLSADFRELAKESLKLVRELDDTDIERLHTDHFMSIRRQLGLAKVSFCVEHIKNILTSEDKIVVFCVHGDVVEALKNELESYNPLVVTGATNLKERDMSVKAFQNSKRNRVFIGNIKAAGVGLTLTAARYALFVEQDFVPGNNAQAADRIHRIGQNRTVIIDRVEALDTMDTYLAELVQNKWDNIKEVM